MQSSKKSIIECENRMYCRYLAYEVFRKAVVGPAQERISGDEFVSWWRSEGLIGADSDTCVFRVLRQPSTDYLTQGDLTQFMQHVLHHHPGLEFLQARSDYVPVFCGACTRIKARWLWNRTEQ